MRRAVTMGEECVGVKDGSSPQGQLLEMVFLSLYFSDRRKKCYLDSKGFKFIA